MTTSNSRLLYQRGSRWWADFRRYEGGDREPLVPEGKRMATRDRAEAEVLYDARLEELEARRDRVFENQPPSTAGGMTIRRFAPVFLKLKAGGDVTERTMTRAEQALRTALANLRGPDGRKTDAVLGEFTPAMAGDVMVNLRSYVSPDTKKKLSARTQRYALDVLAEMYKWAAFQGHVPAGFNPVRAIPRRTRVRSRHYDHLDEYEAAALLEAMFELEGAITPRIMLTVILALAGVRPEEGARVTRRDANLNSGRWQILATKDQGRTELDDTRYVPIWPYARAVLEAFEKSNGPRAPESRLCVSEGRKQRSGQEVAIQDSRVLYRKAWQRAIELLDEWGVEHRLARKRVVPRCWRTTYASARAQTLDNGAPVALGTVRVEMGHKSLLMLTRVYERVGEIRSRREVVEYRRPDGRLPGEDLLRQVLGERFDEIMGTGETRPTLRVVG